MLSSKISSLHRDYIKKIRAYRFDKNELIDSDHVDFIGKSCSTSMVSARESLTL